MSRGIIGHTPHTYCPPTSVAMSDAMRLGATIAKNSNVQSNLIPNPYYSPLPPQYKPSLNSTNYYSGKPCEIGKEYELNPLHDNTYQLKLHTQKIKETERSIEQMNTTLSSASYKPVEINPHTHFSNPFSSPFSSPFSNPFSSPFSNPFGRN